MRSLLAELESSIHFIPHQASLSRLESALVRVPKRSPLVCLGTPRKTHDGQRFRPWILELERGDVLLVEMEDCLLFSRKLLEAILPFPPQSVGSAFSARDWIVAIAGSVGDIRLAEAVSFRAGALPLDRQALRAAIKRAVAAWEASEQLEAEYVARLAKLSAKGLRVKRPGVGSLGRRAQNLVGFAAHSLRARTYQRPRSSAEFRDARSSRELNIAVREGVTRRPAFNLLLPHLKFNQVFGGMATALKLGIELAKREQHVRLFCTDSTLTPRQRRDFDDYLARQCVELGELRSRMELCDVSAEARGGPVVVGESDFFIATAWWTALLADRALRSHELSRKKFIYLIQDFEPGFYPWSQEYALAESSYRLRSFLPVFNTKFLEDYFRENGYLGEREHWTIRPEIDLERFFPHEAKKMEKARPRLLFYGRPSVPRNLFPLIVAGLDEWIRSRGLGPEDIEIISAGERHGEIRCPNGIAIRSVGLVDNAAYPDFLREFDIGISLMLSPHPSYPPLEMAASGILTITNSYGTKDLAGVSSNFIVSEPSPEALVSALDASRSRVNRHAERIRGSRLKLPPSLSLAELVERFLSLEQPAKARKLPRKGRSPEASA